MRASTRPPYRYFILLHYLILLLLTCFLLWSSSTLKVDSSSGGAADITTRAATSSLAGTVRWQPPAVLGRAQTSSEDAPLSHTSDVCVAAMGRLITSAPADVWPPPCPAPEALRAAFEGPDGSMPLVGDRCQAQRYEGELVVDWNAAFINEYCAGLAAGTKTGSYLKEDDELVASVLGEVPGMAGSVGMVLGSERPWVECFALNAGAATVWTFEYATILSTHPKLKAKPCKVMAAEHVTGKLPLVDWIVSYSSLEHSGLGRYGDALNPDGDKEAVLQALCMLKPGGLLLLGLPSTCEPKGFVEFNSHRIYGFKRLAYIAEGFELVKFTRPCVAVPSRIAANIIILRKPVGPAPARTLTEDDFQRAAGGNA